MRIYVVLLPVILLPFLSSCAGFRVNNIECRSSESPKNIILFIADGMGVSHVTAAKIIKGKLNLERFKTLGLLTTHSLSNFVSDSASAGTALATGFKTRNRTISVNSANMPLKTIVEYAEENQMRTGLVVSSSVTHATPAVFVAHVNNRKKQDDIAEHIADSGVDVLFGGGWAYFVPKSVEGSRRSDDKDLLTVMGNRMQVIRSGEEFEKIGDVDSIAGFFAANHPPRFKNRTPKLPDLTSKAIEILSKNKNGFFLMVEGSQVDWAAHKNNSEDLVTEMIDFDNAVGVGLDFAESDLCTAVIVTADHETGGFAVHKGSVDQRVITKSQFTSKGHTATMVPIFAYGPGSSAFSY